MSEEPSEPSKDATSRTAESFATWLSLFGVSPAGTPVPPKPATGTTRARKDRAASTGDDAAAST
jgi:hypothetical protein